MTEIRTIRALASEINKAFPSFSRIGGMLLLGSVDYLLRAIDLDSSGFSKTSFYPTVFVQPLYEPKDYFFFTFGARLQAPRGGTWDLAESSPRVVLENLKDAISGQAIPFLKRLVSPLDLALACEESRAAEFHWPLDDINVLESAAYSWLIAGNATKCLEKLESAHQAIAATEDDREWVRVLDRRLQQFTKWLNSGKEQEALEQLHQWRSESVRALKLQKFTYGASVVK